MVSSSLYFLKVSGSADRPAVSQPGGGREGRGGAGGGQHAARGTASIEGIAYSAGRGSGCTAPAMGGRKQRARASMRCRMLLRAAVPTRHVPWGAGQSGTSCPADARAMHKANRKARAPLTVVAGELAVQVGGHISLGEGACAAERRAGQHGIGPAQRAGEPQCSRQRQSLSAERGPGPASKSRAGLMRERHSPSHLGLSGPYHSMARVTWRVACGRAEGGGRGQRWWRKGYPRMPGHWHTRAAHGSALLTGPPGAPCTNASLRGRAAAAEQGQRADAGRCSPWQPWASAGPWRERTKPWR